MDSPRKSFLTAADVYRECDADVYQSMEATISTYIAMRAMPDRSHIVSFQDPRDRHDWKVEFDHASHGRAQMLLTYLYYENPLTWRSVRRADGLYCPAKYLIPKVRKKYGLSFDSGFLPTPVKRPAEPIRKAEKPVVCFLGRLDKVKRPDRFLELARHFPDVTFRTIGKAIHPQDEVELKQKYGHLPNVEMMGFIDQFSSDGVSRQLAECWILVNTSAKEALPNTFIEAAAHRCAILGPVDPDGFTTRSGYHVTDGDYAKGLRILLENDTWKERGDAGFKYFMENYENDIVIDRHISEYSRLI